MFAATLYIYEELDTGKISSIDVRLLRQHCNILE